VIGLLKWLEMHLPWISGENETTFDEWMAAGGCIANGWRFQFGLKCRS
jgi:hypothetical protein